MRLCGQVAVWPSNMARNEAASSSLVPHERAHRCLSSQLLSVLFHAPSTYLHSDSLLASFCPYRTTSEQSSRTAFRRSPLRRLWTNICRKSAPLSPISSRACGPSSLPSGKLSRQSTGRTPLATPAPTRVNHVRPQNATHGTSRALAGILRHR